MKKHDPDLKIKQVESLMPDMLDKYQKEILRRAYIDELQRGKKIIEEGVKLLDGVINDLLFLLGAPRKEEA